MQQFLTSSNVKQIRFQKEEYIKRCRVSPDFGFSPYTVITNSVCLYIAMLTASDMPQYKHIRPSWWHTECVFEYVLSDFEIEDLRCKTEEELAFLLADFELKIPFAFEKGVLREKIKGILIINFLCENYLEFPQKINVKFYIKYQQYAVGTFFEYIAMYDSNEMVKYLLAQLKRLFELRYSKLKRETLAIDVKDNFLIFSNDFVHSIKKAVLFEKGSSCNFNMLTLDVMDLLIYIYMKKNPVHEDKSVIFSIDDILYLRRIKKAINSEGREGGYSKQYREVVAIQIDKLSNLEVNKDKIFYINAFKKLSYGKKRYFYTLKFGNFLQKELKYSENFMSIPSIIYSYHTKRNFYAKKIAYHLFYNHKKLKEIKVKDFMDSILEKEKVERPNIVRDKFENALDKLVKDKIIKSWCYKNIEENAFNKKYWYDYWLNLELIIKM